LSIHRVGIDTGGGASSFGKWSRTEEIYAWLRQQQPSLVYGTKGISTRDHIQLVRAHVIDTMPRSRQSLPTGADYISQLLSEERARDTKGRTY